MPSRRSAEDEGGASAVEFALLLPILIVLVFGILYGGLLMNRQLSVTQAAREGARYGATFPVSAEDEYDDLFSAVRQRAAIASAGTVSADQLCVWFVSVVDGATADPANAGCPSAPPGEAPDDEVSDRVFVYVEQPAVLDLVLYRFNTTVRGRSVARHEGGLVGAA